MRAPASPPPGPPPGLQISRLQAKLAAAEEAARSADGIAQAAMEAAEEAVRDEMETIAVCKETENALLKAIEDLRFLDDTSGGEGGGHAVSCWGHNTQRAEDGSAV